MPRAIRKPLWPTALTQINFRRDLASMVGLIFRSQLVRQLLNRVSATTKRSHHGLHPIVYQHVRECTDFKLAGSTPRISRKLTVIAPPDTHGGISPHKHGKTHEAFEVLTITKPGSYLLLGDPSDEQSFRTIELFVGQKFDAPAGIPHGFHLPPGAKLVLSIIVTHFNAKDIQVVSEEIPKIPEKEARRVA